MCANLNKALWGESPIKSSLPGHNFVFFSIYNKPCIISGKKPTIFVVVYLRASPTALFPFFSQEVAKFFLFNPFLPLFIWRLFYQPLFLLDSVFLWEGKQVLFLVKATAMVVALCLPWAFLPPHILLSSGQWSWTSEPSWFYHQNYCHTNVTRDRI